MDSPNRDALMVQRASLGTFCEGREIEPRALPKTNFTLLLVDDSKKIVLLFRSLSHVCCSRLQASKCWFCLSVCAFCLLFLFLEFAFVVEVTLSVDHDFAAGPRLCR